MTSSPSGYSSLLHPLIIFPPVCPSSETKLLLLGPLHYQRATKGLLEMEELYSVSLQTRVSPAKCTFHLEIYTQAEFKTRQVVCLRFV